MELTKTAGATDRYTELTRFFDEFATVEARCRARNRAYHSMIESAYRFHVPRRARVLEIGCGTGDLLAALEPTVGVGVDISPVMVQEAAARHPELRFDVAAGEDLELGETFDYIVLSDLVPYVHDLVALLERVAAHSHPRTRIILNSYSQLWRPANSLAERLRLKAPKPIRNWVSPQDARGVLELAGFEVVLESRRMLMPKQVPLLTAFANRILANIWPLNHLCLTYWLVARPVAAPYDEELGVSVICPCRNEAGHVPALVARLPAMGRATELIFVEGGSTDDTRPAIEREIERWPARDISLIGQPGHGKGDAVRAGFAAAKHEVLMILDGDISVSPEDLPKFYRALQERRGELVNGTRLVYDLEPGAMRFLNVVGNRLFSRMLRAILGQHVTDTLCGTKVLHRDDYALIAAQRTYFGDFDPFGDFDLLFGAGKLGLRIVNLPVRYGARTYGETNISRFRHGLLLARMTTFAFAKFRLRVLETR